MQLDPESIRQAFTALGTVLTLLKQAKDLLPENAKKQEISQTIEKVEKELLAAEAESARALGYEICRDHWPPGIMLSADNKSWRCPMCGNQKIPLHKKQNPWSSLGNT